MNALEHTILSSFNAAEAHNFDLKFFSRHIKMVKMNAAEAHKNG